MRTPLPLLLCGTALLVVQVAAQRPAATPASGPPRQQTASGFRYVGTVRDVMHVLVEPAADALFGAVEVNVTADGIHEKRPQTAEEWDALEHSAIALAEAGNLLKMEGRPIARREEMNVDPEGPELPPAQIEKRLASSRKAWNAYVDAMQNAAVQSLKHIQAKDVQGIVAVGQTIDDACEGCHLAYWYPDDAKNRR